MRLTFAKVTTALLILAASSPMAFAAKAYKGVFKGEAPAPCVVPCMLKDGFYVGAQVGYDSYRVREHFTSTNPSTGTTATYNPVLAANGWVGGLMLGYGAYLNDVFYLGAEVMGNYSDASVGYTATVGTYAADNDFRVRGSWGLAVLPGVRLNDTSLGYVRLGYNWAKIKATASSTDFGSVSKENTSGGFNFGVGIETLMYESWSVRGEFTHTNYSNFHVASGIKVEPSDNQFMLGVIYHFCL